MAQDEVLDRIAAVDVFAGLSKRQHKRIAGAGRTTTLEAGKVVAEEGKDALAFHLVLDGALEVSVRGNVVRRLGPGDYFGEISMIDGKPRSATVTATEPTQCFALQHSSFEDLILAEPLVAKAMLETLAGRLREAESR